MFEVVHTVIIPEPHCNVQLTIVFPSHLALYNPATEMALLRK
jgi:hypothetical protein